MLSCCVNAKRCTVTTYWEAMNYLVQKYATDDVISETDPKMMGFSQQQKNTTIRYIHVLFLGQGPVLGSPNKEYMPERNLIEGLPDFIFQIMCSFWACNKQVALQYLLLYKSFLTNLQKFSRTGETTRSSDRLRNLGDNRRYQTVAAIILSTI